MTAAAKLPPPHRLDWTVHPGEIIEDELKERGLRQADLARLTGHSIKHVNQVIRGRVGLSAPFALAIEDATGISALVLVRVQADHSLWRAVQARKKHR